MKAIWFCIPNKSSTISYVQHLKISSEFYFSILEAALQRWSKEKVLRKYVANLQKNTHAEKRFATLLKSHFSMGVLLIPFPKNTSGGLLLHFTQVTLMFQRTEGTIRRYSTKKVLLKILQNFHKKTSESEASSLQIYEKRNSVTGVSLWILQNF